MDMDGQTPSCSPLPGRALGAGPCARAWGPRILWAKAPGSFLHPPAHLAGGFSVGLMQHLGHWIRNCAYTCRHPLPGTQLEGRLEALAQGLWGCRQTPPCLCSIHLHKSQLFIHHNHLLVLYSWSTVCEQLSLRCLSALHRNAGGYADQSWCSFCNEEEENDHRGDNGPRSLTPGPVLFLLEYATSVQG